MLFDRTPLTPPQLRLYRVLLAFWRDEARPPTIREISARTGTRPNAVFEVLRTLRDRKYIAANSVTPVEISEASKRDAALMLGELSDSSAVDPYDRPHPKDRSLPFFGE